MGPRGGVPPWPRQSSESSRTPDGGEKTPAGCETSPPRPCWKTKGRPEGRALTYLDGCEYVDISETPFTNTLPIRRLGLSPGESAEISVAYLDATELQPWPEPQRYACVQTDSDGRLYRFVSLDGGVTVDLPLDADGLVFDYPGLFRRVLP